MYIQTKELMRGRQEERYKKENVKRADIDSKI